MADLKDSRIICVKGALFLICGVLSAAVLFSQSPTLSTVLLTAVTVWSFCRFYYFAFYVVEHYVDDSYRFAGLLDFVMHWFGVLRQKRRLSNGSKPAPANWPRSTDASPDGPSDYGST